MTDQDDPGDQDTGWDAGIDEKRATYPDDGYALVEIDMLKPPGKALTTLGEFETLEEITMPEATELTDYVVYDAEGGTYTHEDL